MKIRSGISAVFAMLAAMVAAASVFLVVTSRGRQPVLLYAPEEAKLCVEEMMEAICDGDFVSAAGWMYGSPDLGIAREPEDAVNKTFWNAFVSSLDYELVGQLYATDTGTAQDVKIISMELAAATQGMEQAADASEIYDASNGYKDSFVESVITQAAQDALEEDTRYSYRIVTLQLVYSGDQWWVMPNRELLNAISGGTAG